MCFPALGYSGAAGNFMDETVAQLPYIPLVPLKGYLTVSHQKFKKIENAHKHIAC